MAQRRYTRQVSGNPLGNFGAIAVAVFLLIALYFIAKTIFSLLWWVAPLLLLITLVMDYKVVVNYGKWVFKMFGINPLAGIGLSLLTIFGFPVVSVFLFGKAMLKKKLNEVTQQYQERVEGEYVDYEEVPDNEIVPDEDVMELPPIKPKQKQTRTRNKGNEYEDLFE